MKKLRTKVQEYHSIEEYVKRFYPESYRKQLPLIYSALFWQESR